jgi:hypothetical protein
MLCLRGVGGFFPFKYAGSIATGLVGVIDRNSGFPVALAIWQKFAQAHILSYRWPIFA